MAYTTTELAIQEYKKMYPHTEGIQYTVTGEYADYGVLIKEWYQRSSWVDDTLERSLLFKKGQILERGKVVGTYKELE